MPKPAVVGETYVVRELFACGEGHFLPPGFTHWEEGEVCPHGHSDVASERDVHLYYRRIMVPLKSNDGSDLWEKVRAEPNRWGQCPVAP